MAQGNQLNLIYTKWQAVTVSKLKYMIDFIVLWHFIFLSFPFVMLIP